jgi:hypothetical protein
LAVDSGQTWENKFLASQSMFNLPSCVCVCTQELFVSKCLAFQIIQSKAWLHIDTKEDYKMYMEIEVSV